MSKRDYLGRIYDVTFREFPHRGKTGLMKLGDPGRDSPVVVTGNYTETVRRVKEALKGENVWLLVANSKGINVWCAAGGGHLTHHDVISAVLTSAADSRVDNHTLILPQLGATGIERQKISDATGWTSIWGPARVEDLPSFLHQGYGATPRQRFMRFPFRERMEMALMWWFPIVIIGIPLFAWLGGWPVGMAVGMEASTIAFGIFAGLPRLKVKGSVRWVTFTCFALTGFAMGTAVLLLTGATSIHGAVLAGAGATLATGVLSVDLAGTTPWYGSYINTFRNKARIELVAERCTGTSECVQVCPRNVFEMAPFKRMVNVVRQDDCIQCGACVVQCPRDALWFRYDDGRIVEASTIRNTRMNMLGRRAIFLQDNAE